MTPFLEGVQLSQGYRTTTRRRNFYHKSIEYYLIDLQKTKGCVDLGAKHWF